MGTFGSKQYNVRYKTIQKTDRNMLKQRRPPPPNRNYIGKHIFTALKQNER